jgi:hypothetical protein
MDIPLASSAVAAIAGQVQTALAGKAAATDQQQGSAAAVNQAEYAQQNIDSLVNLAAGIGTNVNIKA